MAPAVTYPAEANWCASNALLTLHDAPLFIAFKRQKGKSKQRVLRIECHNGAYNNKTLTPPQAENKEIVRN